MPTACRFCGLKAPGFIRSQVIEVSQVSGGRGESETNPWRKTGGSTFGGGGGFPAERSGYSFAIERVPRGAWEANPAQKESPGGGAPPWKKSANRRNPGVWGPQAPQASVKHQATPGLKAPRTTPSPRGHPSPQMRETKKPKGGAAELPFWSGICYNIFRNRGLPRRDEKR